MTQEQAEAFAAALTALCRRYGVSLGCTDDYDLHLQRVEWDGFEAVLQCTPDGQQWSVTTYVPPSPPSPPRPERPVVMRADALDDDPRLSDEEAAPILRRTDWPTDRRRRRRR